MSGTVDPADRIRIGETLRMKFVGGELVAEVVECDGYNVIWETPDGRQGRMTGRLWDLNRERQRTAAETRCEGSS
ncbi:hypothetical protein [Paludisphaera sp.]|uniref:hypothetical protein n=1 Tax=Paludisphaera sp. TaxID=2017432 RepID=UPI00301C0B1D